jgi:hypothetical protein
MQARDAVLDQGFLTAPQDALRVCLCVCVVPTPVSNGLLVFSFSVFFDFAFFFSFSILGQGVQAAHPVLYQRRRWMKAGDILSDLINQTYLL